jgi:opacity protein-like surface antigen
MRRILLAAIMFGAASGAQAADMPDFLRGSLSAGSSIPNRNWDGWYAGGQVSYSSAHEDFTRTTVSLTNSIFRNSVLQDPVSQFNVLPKVNVQGTGFGAFVGRNYQWEDLVLGVEANYNYLNNLTASVSGSLGPLSIGSPPGSNPPPGHTYTYNVTLAANAALQIKDVVTFRGRAGWASGNFMPYVFGGLAVGRMDVARSTSSIVTRRDDTFTTVVDGNGNVITIPTGSTTTTIPSASQTVSERRTNNFVVGWTGGLGLEYLLWGNVFLRGEWEYVKFLSVKDTVVSMNSLRAGIGYKF